MDDLDLGKTITGLVAGQKVFGRYTLKRILGRGGMGVVWLAEDNELSREVALKFLPESIAVDRGAIADLKRETRRALELTHPHIVRIYDFVSDVRYAAISMEYVAGESLAARRADQPDGHFEVADLEKWIRQLCEALEYAHTKARVVHRDLKPANLMLDAHGDLKITDFGISATLSDSRTRVSMITGTSGTPVYMSPQQMMGEKPAATDDIYSLGATLYELLTGKPPFYTGRIETQILNKIPPSVAARRAEDDVPGTAVPENWEAVIADCLAKEPAGRPPTARDVIRRLEHAVASRRESPAASAEPRPAAARRPASDAADVPPLNRPANPTPWKLLAAIGGAVALSLAYYLGIHAPAQKREEAARIEAARLAAARGGLIVRSSPVGAEVRVGAVAVEKTPFTLKDMRLGRYPVSARLAGYDDWSTNVEINENEFGELDITLQRSLGSAKIDSVPGGLRFLLKSAERTLEGTTPAVLPGLPTGEYELAVSRPGWPDRREKVVVERSRQAAASFSFVGGGIELDSTPAGATVFRDGAVLGRTPFHVPEMVPGPLALEIRLNGYRTAKVAVEVKPGETAKSMTVLAPEDRRLDFLAMDLVAIAAGEFTMGSPEDEPGRFADEGPPTRVKITRPFWISRTEITQAQWRTVMGKGLLEHLREALADDEKRLLTDGKELLTYREAWGRNASDNPELLCSNVADDQPMTFVSWLDAQAFARRLTERAKREGNLPAGYEYRLPTEAEWEYACRAGTTTALPSGPIVILGKHHSPSLSKLAWYGGNSSMGFSGRGFATTDWPEKESPGGLAGTRSVGSRDPNPWGLSDMLGNVAEWTYDTKDERYLGGKASDPLNFWGSDQRNRVIRGGSYFSEARFCRAAARQEGRPATRNMQVGFRVCLAPVIDEKFGRPVLPPARQERAAHLASILLLSELYRAPGLKFRVVAGELRLFGLAADGRRSFSPADIGKFASITLIDRKNDTTIRLFFTGSRRGEMIGVGRGIDAKDGNKVDESKLARSVTQVEKFREWLDDGLDDSAVSSVFGYVPQAFADRAEALAVLRDNLKAASVPEAKADNETMEWKPDPAKSETQLNRFDRLERVDLVETNDHFILIPMESKGGRAIGFNKSGLARARAIRDALVYLIVTSPPPPEASK